MTRAWNGGRSTWPPKSMGIFHFAKRDLRLWRPQASMKASEFAWVRFERATGPTNTQEKRQKGKRQTPARGVCLGSGEVIWIGVSAWVRAFGAGRKMSVLSAL